MRPPSDIAVRAAGPDDARAIADLFLASRAESLPQVSPLLNDAETRDYLAGLIDSPHYAVWVAERGSTLVGFLVLRDGWVDHLYVHPGCYRHGIGTLLLDRAKRASPLGLRLFCFHCDQRARAFYAAGGLVAVRGSGASPNPEGEPDVEYRWHGSAA